MVSVNEVYEQCRAISAKSYGTGYLSPKLFNQLAPMASLDLFNELFRAYQVTQQVTDALRYFITPKRLIVDTYGHLSYPSDYMDLLAVRAFDPISFEEAMESCSDGTTTPNYDEISQISVYGIDNSQLGIRLESPNFKPTLDNPIYVQYKDWLQLYPKNIGVVMLDYLRKPATPFWAYTTPVNLPVYDAANSTQFDWSATMQNQLVDRIVELFGVSVRDAEIVNLKTQVQ